MLATVLAVHVDEDPPYYTILQDDGLERQTVLRYLLGLFAGLAP